MTGLYLTGEERENNLCALECAQEVLRKILKRDGLLVGPETDAALFQLAHARASLTAPRYEVLGHTKEDLAGLLIILISDNWGNTTVTKLLRELASTLQEPEEKGKE